VNTAYRVGRVTEHDFEPTNPGKQHFYKYRANMIQKKTDKNIMMK